MKTNGDVVAFHLFLTLVLDVTADSFMTLLFPPVKKPLVPTEKDVRWAKELA